MKLFRFHWPSLSAEIIFHSCNTLIVLLSTSYFEGCL
jgi:hypothetical protein